MIPKKRDFVAIVGKMPPPDKLKQGAGKPAAKDEDEDDEEGMGLESAVGDFFRLGKSGDTKGAAAALQDAIELCGYRKGR